MTLLIHHDYSRDDDGGDCAVLVPARLRWARAVCRSREVVDDIGLAVYEALANVIDHAYPPAPRMRCRPAHGMRSGHANCRGR